MENKVRNSPYEADLLSGKRYFRCSCGLSQTQPFCDGAHKGSGKKPLPFDVVVPQTARLCGCKRTKNPPYCDGTHHQAEK